MLARLLLIASVVLGTVVMVLPASGSRQREAAGPWTGTVRIVDDANHDFSNSGLIVHLTYHDEAVYTLTGETTSGGLSMAQMTGSGRGVVTYTSPGACVLSYDPLLQWSYSGQALVSVSYSGGRYVVQPQPVVVDYNSLLTGCGAPDTPVPAQLVAPFGMLQVQPQGETASATATALTGSESFPVPYPLTGFTENAGTVTLSWDLKRTGATPPPPSTGPPAGEPSGSVLVNGKRFTGGQIPFGSTVDVTNGRLKLVSSVGTLTVSGGGVSAAFKLLRSTDQGKTAVELRLIKGDFSVCKKAFRTTQAAKPPKKTVRRLFANGKGRFRTRGRYSAAAVRGTNWLTADRCDGTLTSVKQGKVEVNDLVKHKKVLVKAGKSYLATPKR